MRYIEGEGWERVIKFIHYYHWWAQATFQHCSLSLSLFLPLTLPPPFSILQWLLGKLYCAKHPLCALIRISCPTHKTCVHSCSWLPKSWRRGQGMGVRICSSAARCNFLIKFPCIEQDFPMERRWHILPHLLSNLCPCHILCHNLWGHTDIIPPYPLATGAGQVPCDTALSLWNHLVLWTSWMIHTQQTRQSLLCSTTLRYTDMYWLSLLNFHVSLSSTETGIQTHKHTGRIQISYGWAWYRTEGVRNTCLWLLLPPCLREI